MIITLEQVKELLKQGYRGCIVSHETEYCGCSDDYNALVAEGAWSDFYDYVDIRAHDHLTSMDIIDWIIEEVNDQFGTDDNIEDFSEEMRDIYDNLEAANLNQSSQDVTLESDEEILDFIEYADEDNFIVYGKE